MYSSTCSSNDMEVTVFIIQYTKTINNLPEKHYNLVKASYCFLDYLILLY